MKPRVFKLRRVASPNQRRARQTPTRQRSARAPTQVSRTASVPRSVVSSRPSRQHGMERLEKHGKYQIFKVCARSYSEKGGNKLLGIKLIEKRNLESSLDLQDLRDAFPHFDVHVRVHSITKNCVAGSLGGVQAGDILCMPRESEDAAGPKWKLTAGIAEFRAKVKKLFDRDGSCVFYVARKDPEAETVQSTPLPVKKRGSKRAAVPAANERPTKLQNVIEIHDDEEDAKPTAVATEKIASDLTTIAKRLRSSLSPAAADPEEEKDEDISNDDTASSVAKTLSLAVVSPSFATGAARLNSGDPNHMRDTAGSERHAVSAMDELQCLIDRHEILENENASLRGDPVKFQNDCAAWNEEFESAAKRLLDSVNRRSKAPPLNAARNNPKYLQKYVEQLQARTIHFKEENKALKKFKSNADQIREIMQRAAQKVAAVIDQDINSDRDD